MGDFKGHAIPGSLFLFLGLWWAVGCLKRYLKCRHGNQKYRTSATYSCPCPCGNLTSRLPVEAMMKIFLSGLGSFGEITFNLPVPSMGIIQHATMYFFFLMSGIVDLVMHCGVPLPPGTDYVALALALTVEGLLFANHLHGRPPVDVQLHMLLVYVVFVTVLVILLEARHNHSAVLAMSRSFLLMLQGSWFWAAGIILYGHGDLTDGKNDVWDMNDHMQVMQVTIYFTWHCAAHLLILFSMTLLAYCLYRRVHGAMPSSNGHSGIPLNPLDTPGEGEDKEYKRLVFHDDTDSDIEFERPFGKEARLTNGPDH